MGIIVKCAYCGKEKGIEDMENKTMSYPAQYNSGIKIYKYFKKVDQWYCRDTQCYTSMRFAHDLD